MILTTTYLSQICISFAPLFVFFMTDLFMVSKFCTKIPLFYAPLFACVGVDSKQWQQTALYQPIILHTSIINVIRNQVNYSPLQNFMKR